MWLMNSKKFPECLVSHNHISIISKCLITNIYYFLLFGVPENIHTHLYKQTIKQNNKCIPLTFSDRSRLPIFSRASRKTLTVVLLTLLCFHSPNIAMPFSTTRRCSISIFVSALSGIPRRLPSIFQLVLRSSTRSWRRASDTGVLSRLVGTVTAAAIAKQMSITGMLALSDGITALSQVVSKTYLSNCSQELTLSVKGLRLTCF